MTIPNVKAMVAKVMTVGLLAGAFTLATPAKAQAETFVGVQVGYPHYDNARRDYFEFQRREAFRRHEEFVRHEEWVRAHEFDRFHRDGYWRR
jgi:hypothetical protein